MTINVGDIKTVEQLDEWVKYRGTKFGMYDQYKAALEACKALVAVQYPGKKFDWPAPSLQAGHTTELGVRRNMFAHLYEFPDGFKTGVLLFLGVGEFDRYITDVIFVDQKNQVTPVVSKEDKP